MRMLSVSALLCVLFLSTAYGATEEEIETYLIAPFTKDHDVTLTMSDGKKVQGRVTSGDDSKIVVQQASGNAEIATSEITSVHFRRAKRSARTDFIGSLVGGVGMGFAGGAIGRTIAKNIRDDGTSGRVGPVVGGLVLGMAGGYIGQFIMRKSVFEEVTLKIVPEARSSTTQMDSLLSQSNRSHLKGSKQEQKNNPTASVTHWTAGMEISMADVPDAAVLTGFSKFTDLMALRTADVASGVR